MSILTELVRLFRDNDRAALEEALTDDTIRALLDVAEAAERRRVEEQRLIAALAKLNIAPACDID